MFNIINLYRQAEDYFFKGISSKCLDLSDNTHAYMTNVPLAGLNLVYINKKTKNICNIITKSHHFFDQYNLPFVVILPQNFCTNEANIIFKNMDYCQHDSSVSTGPTHLKNHQSI